MRTPPAPFDNRPLPPFPSLPPSKGKGRAGGLKLPVASPTSPISPTPSLLRRRPKAVSIYSAPCPRRPFPSHYRRPRSRHTRPWIYLIEEGIPSGTLERREIAAQTAACHRRPRGPRGVRMERKGPRVVPVCPRELKVATPNGYRREMLRGQPAAAFTAGLPAEHWGLAPGQLVWGEEPR